MKKEIAEYNQKELNDFVIPTLIRMGIKYELFEIKKSNQFQLLVDSDVEDWVASELIKEEIKQMSSDDIKIEIEDKEPNKIPYEFIM